MLKNVGKAWRGWLKFAQLLGNVQMIFLLSVVYWTMLAVLALPCKLLSDPLALRRRSRAGWTRRQPMTDISESMRKQG